MMERRSLLKLKAMSLIGGTPGGSHRDSVASSPLSSPREPAEEVPGGPRSSAALDAARGDNSGEVQQVHSTPAKQGANSAASPGAAERAERRASLAAALSAGVLAPALRAAARCSARTEGEGRARR